MNLNEQRMALSSLLDSIYRSAEAIRRKRKMRDSEKAMSLGSLEMKATALRMAVAQIDALLKAHHDKGEPVSGFKHYG